MVLASSAGVYLRLTLRPRSVSYTHLDVYKRQALTHPRAPHIDYAAISPFEALLGGSLIVLIVGLLRSRVAREQLVPALTLVTLAATIAVSVWQWSDHISAISGALSIDDLALALTILFAAAGAAAVILSWRGQAPRESCLLYTSRCV